MKTKNFPARRLIRRVRASIREMVRNSEACGASLSPAEVAALHDEHLPAKLIEAARNIRTKKAR